ncbi:alpha/beta hydrolase [Ilumatobacter sp.]|uniref:alpha/beta hydrolase n=1 Tax=Ilumatobacter sp. TaxID=1967498 RepID=UPI003B522E25
MAARPPSSSRRRRPRSAAAAALVLAGIAGACSDSSGGEQPPATRATIPPETAVSSPVDFSEGTATSSVPVSATAPAPSSAGTASAPSSAPSLPDAEIAFEQVADGVEGGWLTVPVDHGDPLGATLDLWVVRHRAPSGEPVGVLLANGGGPGVASSLLAADVRSWFEEPLVESFDIVTWDPRGTGRSGGSVDCIDDDEYDRYFASGDITPDDDAEREALVELSRDFAESCVEAVGDVLAHLGTNNSARDMDALRRALGQSQVSYLGYSYGSELGAVWATLFPDTVRAAVLDGAAHPDPDGIEPVRLQQLGFEGVFETFLARCSANPSCAFHNDGDAEGAYDELLARLDTDPVPGPPGRPAVNQEVAIIGIIQAMYTDRRWPALERALADAAAGDGTGLLALRDGYYRRDPDDGSYSDLLESFQAITCADDPDRPTPDEADAEAEPLIGIAPRLFPYTTGSYTCGFFPPSADPRVEITGERAGPIVVIGTTGDPSTPLTSSQAMADALEGGVLVTVEANRHTAYRSGGCIDDLVHRYLIWLEVPPADTRCG